MGGLGNQLFQIAAAYAHSQRIGEELVLDYNLCYTPNQGEVGTKYDSFLYYQLTKGAVNSSLRIYEEPSFCYEPIPSCRNIILKGYFQSWKYFYDVKSIIQSIFVPPLNILLETQKLLNQIGILDGQFNAIHVRRGDYQNFKDTFHILDHSYYSHCLKVFKKNGLPTLVFSDEPEHARNIINDNSCYLINTGDERIDFCLMRQATNIAIANSSFSWWAAFLLENKDKIVFAPKNWFQKSEMSTRDLIPDGWICT